MRYAQKRELRYKAIPILRSKLDSVSAHDVDEVLKNTAKYRLSPYELKRTKEQ